MNKWELTLPQPPSVNRFMGKLGNRSPPVKAWVRQADMALMLARASRDRATRPSQIRGPFEAHIAFERDRSDFHNRLKPLFDWLQSRELIENDRLCERLVAWWGEVGSGCKVQLRETENAK